MATRGKSVKDADYNRGKNSKKKSPPAFVPLDGLSQSAKDRLMNYRMVKPPRNLNLIEGDPSDEMEFQTKSRQTTAFPNEHLLSSKIKEVNGMDHSNHFIEQYYRNCHSRSISPDISENSTISSSKTKESVLRNAGPEEACTSTFSCSTEVESSNAESDSNFVEPDEMDDAIRNSRYSKNAAIIGMLKNNYISLGDLILDDEEKKNYYSGDGRTDIQDIVKDKNGEDNPKKVHGYPNLVPHPDDPEFFTTPLLAYGKLDDGDIKFGLPRKGEKTVMTPREYFVREALNDDNFKFIGKNTKDMYKPKLNINPGKINPSCSSRDQTYCNGEASNSYDSLKNDEDDGFKMNREEFPTLRK